MIRRRIQCDDVIDLLRLGKEPEFSEAARDQLLAAYFFRDPPLPPELERRVGELIELWHEQHPPMR